MKCFSGCRLVLFLLQDSLCRGYRLQVQRPRTASGEVKRPRCLGIGCPRGVLDQCKRHWRFGGGRSFSSTLSISNSPTQHPSLIRSLTGSVPSHTPTYMHTNTTFGFCVRSHGRLVRMAWEALNTLDTFAVRADSSSAHCLVYVTDADSERQLF